MSFLNLLGKLDFTSRSVFLRCVALLALSTGLVATTLGVMSALTIDQTARRSVQSEALKVTKLVGAQAGGAIMFGKGENLVADFGSLMSGADGAVVGGIAIDASGGVVADAGEGTANADLAPLAAEAVASGEAVVSPDGFSVAVPVRFGKENAIVGALATAWTPETLLAEVRGEQLRAALVALVLFVVTLGVTGWVTRRTVTRPLLAVRAAMSRVADGDRSTEVAQVERRDEIGSIATTLDGFRKSLITADEVAREAVARQAAFENSSSPMMIVDADFVITYVNKAMVALFEEKADELREHIGDFDPTDIVGKSMDVFHRDPSHQRRIMADPSRLPMTANIEVGETAIDLVIAGVHGPDGDFRGAILEWKDVTRVRRNFAILRALDVNQVWVDQDRHGRIVAANANFCQLLGIEKEAALGRAGSDIISVAGDATVERARIDEAMAEGRSYFGRFNLVLNDRSAVVEGSLTPILDRAGRISRRVLIAVDITQAQQAVAAAEAARKVSEDAQAKVVKALGGALEQLSTGDMTVALNSPFAPEYERLREDFNRAMGKLLAAMRAVVENSGAISGEVQGITQAATELSSRTENQAATLEETAAALDQLTASVKLAAERAAQAAQVVDEARTSAAESGIVVREAVAAMGEIEASSDQISKIIGVIDDIAFQTNLLALNAGVEAARAGDAGRGFAVVASEVRALAQRSSDAAREINGLISSSGEQVKRGVGLVGEAGKALDKIVASVGGIAGYVGEIASSSAEQSQGLVEINEAMTQLDQVTQQNAAMFEETSAASQALSRAADALSETVGRFRTDSAPAAAIPLRPTSPKSAPKPAVGSVRAPKAPAPVKAPAANLHAKRPASAAVSLAPAKAPARRSAVNAATAPVADDDGWAEF